MLPVSTGLSSRCIVTTTIASPAHTTDSPAAPAMQSARRTWLHRLDRLDRLVGGCPECVTPGSSAPEDIGLSDFDNRCCSTGVAPPGLRAGRRAPAAGAGCSSRPRPRRRGDWFVYPAWPWAHRQGLGVLATAGGQVRQEGARRGGFRALSSVSPGLRTRPSPGYRPGHGAELTVGAASAAAPLAFPSHGRR